MGFKPTSGGGIDQLTGEVTAGPGTGSQSATIAPVTTAGSIGGATAVPEITYNDAGQITGVASVAPNDISKVPLATVTAAGDLIVGSGAGAVSRLGIGADGDVLTVAAGALGYAAPSDLLQFFQSTLPSSETWYSVAYGNGAFVAVASGTTAAAYTQVVALAGANTAAVTNPTVTSGTAFTPSAASNSTVYFQINATVAGSYTLTMGPTTGTEHTIGSAVAMLVGSDYLVTLNVPRSWLVVLTLTSVTLGSATVVAM